MTRSWSVITNGHVIDIESGSVLPDHDVLINGSTIVKVAPGIDLTQEVPRGEEIDTIDARGKYVAPGLIDMHCHMTYGESYSQEAQDLYTSVEMRTLIAAANLRKVLRAGFTTISQPGGSYYIGVGLREALVGGLIEGPRMHTAGRYLTTSNGLTDWYPDDVGVPHGSIGVLTNTTDEIISEIRHQVKNGVDLIKLADSPYGEYQAFTDGEMATAADLAHQLNRKITIHARGSAEVSAAVRAGMDWIMHGNSMTPEVIEELAASKIPLVPTLLLLANLADFGEKVGVEAHTRDSVKRMLDRTAQTLHDARDAGVRFMVGTDSGFAVTPYGEWHARELQLLRDFAGLSAVEAVRAATTGPAESLGLAGRLGTTRAGAIADLLLLNGNPLRDLSVLLRPGGIATVIQGGRPVADPPEEQERRWHNLRSLTMSNGVVLRRDFLDGIPLSAEPDPLAARDPDLADIYQTVDRFQRDAVIDGD
ncbi:amidohydrolase family protein [Nonomuraea longicatena]|uniref:Amidohydrolase family protein n=1 Tax=Nonomuraea longicatena TaxID=83682 RepID=A0ABP4BMI9_9ACTN